MNFISADGELMNDEQFAKRKEKDKHFGGYGIMRLPVEGEINRSKSPVQGQFASEG